MFWTFYALRAFKSGLGLNAFSFWVLFSSKGHLYGFHFLFLIKVQFFKLFVLVLSWTHVWIFSPIAKWYEFHFGRGYLYGVPNEHAVSSKKNHFGALLKTWVNMPQDSPIFRTTLQNFSSSLLGEEKICETAKVICMVFIIYDMCFYQKYQAW